MKKVLIFLLAVALAVTSMAIVIPASAANVTPNLAEGALAASSDAGDSWSVKPGKWWSPRCEPSAEATSQIASSNNDAGNLVWTREDAESIKTSSIQYSTKAGALKAGKNYEIAVTYKADAVNFVNGVEFALSCDIADSTYCPMTADGDWHTAKIFAATPADYAIDASTTIGLTSYEKKPVAVAYASTVSLEISEFTIYETKKDTVTATSDLLAASGLGNPGYLKENNVAIQNGSWLGHESWNGTKGWDGFTNDGISKRTIVETTLSDGTTGYALRFANDEESTGGSQNGIENIDKICGFEKGKSYIAVATVKVSGPNTNGHNTFIGFNATECAKHGAKVVDIAHTGEWQTVASLPFTYIDGNLTSDGQGAFLEIGFGENWIGTGYELLIEKVSVYEYDSANLLVNGNLYSDLSSGWTSGWGNGGEQGYDAKESHSDDGSGSMYIYNEESAARHISQPITLKAGKTYLIGGWIKTEASYDGGKLQICLGGDSSPWGLGNLAKGANGWTNYEIVFTPEADMDTSYQVRLWGGAGKAYFDDMYVYDLGETAVSYTETAENANISKVWSKGWMGGVSAGFDAEESHTDDGTGSIKLVTCQFNADGTGLEACNQHYSRSVYLQGGVKYSLSAWVKATDTFRCSKAGATGAFVSLTPSAGNWPCSAGYMDTNDVSLDWKFFSTTYTPETSGEYVLSCCAWGNDWNQSTVYFDEICVTPFFKGAEDSPFYAAPAEPTEDQPAVEGNMVSNPNFASNITTAWTSGWAAGKAQEWDSMISHTDDGTGSVRLVNNAEGNQHCAQNISLEAGKTYEISGWIKTSSDFAKKNAGGCGAFIGLADAQGVTIGLLSDAEDTDWHYYTGTYTAEEDLDTVVTLRLWGSGGSAWFDEISVVEQVPENVIVSAIDITGFDVPVAGEAPDKEITIDAPEGAVSDYEIIWYVRVEDEWEEFDGDVFEEDTKYGAQIEIYLNDGFEFGEEVTVSVSDGEIDGDEAVYWNAMSLNIDMAPVTTDVIVPPTSDAAIIVLAVMALALAATVVFSRKRKED